MKRKINFPTLLLGIMSILLFSCSKDKDSELEKVEPFDITNYYVAGTLSPKSGSYKSVYLIKLLDDQKAVFVSSGVDLTGTYTLTADSLLVVVNDPNNFRTARFAINEKYELTSAYYRALSMVYGTTGALIKIQNSNQFAGKTFKGEEFKMGPSLNKQNWFYAFDASGSTYGSAEKREDIAVTNQPEIINNSAFKFKNGSTVEMGFINGDSLTVFRSQGLYYFGNYKKQ